MSEKKITIRLERKDDYHDVENLTREAFWNVYRPGCMEHYLLHCYRDDPALCRLKPRGCAMPMIRRQIIFSSRS